MDATVAHVLDPFTLVLNRGSDHGFERGMRVEVYCMGPEIMDPETEESLGELEIIKGTGRVGNVQENMCTVHSDMRKDAETRVVKRSHPSGIASLGQWFGQEIEETSTPKRQPFRDAEVGDYARIL